LFCQLCCCFQFSSSTPSPPRSATRSLVEGNTSWRIHRFRKLHQAVLHSTFRHSSTKRFPTQPTSVFRSNGFSKLAWFVARSPASQDWPNEATVSNHVCDALFGKSTRSGLPLVASTLTSIWSNKPNFETSRIRVLGSSLAWRSQHGDLGSGFHYRLAVGGLPDAPIRCSSRRNPR